MMCIIEFLFSLSFTVDCDGNKGTSRQFVVFPFHPISMLSKSRLSKCAADSCVLCRPCTTSVLVFVPFLNDDSSPGKTFPRRCRYILLVDRGTLPMPITKHRLPPETLLYHLLDIETR